MPLRLKLAMMMVGSASVLTLVGLIVAAPGAPAQSDLDAARAAVTETTVRLEGLLTRLEETQQRGNELAGDFWQVESTLELLDQRVADAEAERAGLDETRAEVVAEVRQVALNRYMFRDLNMVWDDLDTVADREAAEALAELFVGSDQGTLDRLAAVDAERVEAIAALEAERREQQQTLEAVEAARAGIERDLQELADLHAAIDDELTALDAALDELEAAEAARVAAAEAQRLADARARAEAAAAQAAAIARATPPTPVPVATVVPTAVPNPQPSEPFPTATVVVVEPSVTVVATAVPNPQPSEPFPTATAVPNPQPSEPFPTATVVANPQPSEPSATAVATAVPNPQPSEPFPTATVVAVEPTATAVPNPQPSVPSGGGLVCPLAGPFTHTDDFNAPRAVGGIHRANDLIASTGTPVLAVASGTVEHREASVGGLSAHLRGDNGDYYFYTHLNGYENVGAGHVAAGTVIGYVGMTGNAPIPHLHFEIHRGGYGNYTNPYGPVRTACGT